MSGPARKYSILHFVVMIYLIAAFSWWAILLYNKNEENYKLQQLVHSEEMISIAIQEKYEKQKRMILSEGLFFGLSICIGLFLINRAFRKELRLNQTQNDFLLSVTHELKTPISTLKLVNQTLQKPNITEDKKKDLLETGYEEAVRLENLVNNILTAAQIESSYAFNFESTELSALIEKRVQRFRKLFPTRILSLHKTASMNAMLDVESFTKVVDNIIHNALKYSPSNTEVKVTLGTIGNNCYIEITDQGPGIAEQEQTKIWDKFYRIGNEETRVTQGTGLGLWIAKEIISAHKGHIAYQSNKPKGSKFKITIPTIA